MFHIVNNLQSQVFEVNTVQRSRYENLIITLVHAYSGFPFYLPAFIDCDASANGYQILSYYVFNKQRAIFTNLIPSQDGKIQDLYSFLREELLIYLSKKLPRKTYSIFDKILTRTLTKSIFMPLIYGYICSKEEEIGIYDPKQNKRSKGCWLKGLSLRGRRLTPFQRGFPFLGFGYHTTKEEWIFLTSLGSSFNLSTRTRSTI
ncbi:hypothetical protein M9H77_13715 [Catharanthus roseus]|uniref:Uncharacterized protein n=1 Tax=Catharanthus roseus TaxID=4058 RepID=A0ACC0BL08_CATRO|nr:hypothetical protein M9H77_13715 [Catharanthus roseus]